MRLRCLLIASLLLKPVDVSLCGDGPQHNISASGTQTGLSGYFPRQLNHSIAIGPTSGNIHVIFSAAEDSSIQFQSSRRTLYALSTSGGATWNTFGNLTVPPRPSSSPRLTLLQGPQIGLPTIANTSDVGGMLQSTVHIDSPEGAGAFSELNTPPIMQGESPITPLVAGSADGSVILLASRSTTRTCHITRTHDFSAWSPWNALSGATRALSLAANATGAVAALTAGPLGEIQLWESSNNGVSWPSTPRVILPAPIVFGDDSFFVSGNCDMVYNGNQIAIVIPVSRLSDTLLVQSNICFWSDSTGKKLLVNRSPSPPYGIADSVVRCDGIRASIGEPSIGLTRERQLALLFHGIRRTPSGLRGDIFGMLSPDSGRTWQGPLPVTSTVSKDETYPSIAKQTPLSFFTPFGVWIERDDPCVNSRAYQGFGPVYFFVQSAHDAGPYAKSFKLHQNYPNPFNPGTEIRYQMSEVRHVTLKVYDVLGREVATLVDEVKSAGQHSAQFDASSFSSGLYYYRLQAGNYIATKKMILIR